MNDSKALVPTGKSSIALAKQATDITAYHPKSTELLKHDPWAIIPHVPSDSDAKDKPKKLSPHDVAITLRLKKLEEEKAKIANDPCKKERVAAINREMGICDQALPNSDGSPKEVPPIEAGYPFGTVAALVIASIVMFVLIAVLMAVLGKPEATPKHLTNHERFLRDVGVLKADGFEVVEYMVLQKGEVYQKIFTNTVRFQVVGSEPYTVLTPNDTSAPTDVNNNQYLDVGRPKTIYNFSLRAKSDNTEIAMMQKIYDGSSNPVNMLFKLIDKLFSYLFKAIGIVLLVALFIAIAGVAILIIILTKRLFFPRKA